MFAGIGFIALLMQPAKYTPATIAEVVLTSACFAVVYAWLATIRKFWYMPILGIVEGVGFSVIYSVAAPTSLANHPDALRSQLASLGVCAVVCVCLGYVLFIVFIRRESKRYFRIQAEIDLAREIHLSLVPSFERRIGQFEIFGASTASGTVGGDLVDLAESPAGWISYIADISGHGVQSGVLMAMFKTAIRSRMTDGSSPSALLDDVHRTLFPLKMSNMFVTAGVLEIRGGSRVNFALAGHPPLLRYSRSRQEVMEYPAQNLPLGVLADQHFAGESLECDPGDVLLLLTDGFTEVFDHHGNELGLEPLKSAFVEIVGKPLPSIFDALRNIALRFGKQDDDQTMLLLRCGER